MIFFFNERLCDTKLIILENQGAAAIKSHCFVVFQHAQRVAESGSQ